MERFGPAGRAAAQPPETAWVIWETAAPVQRLAIDGEDLWVGMYKAGLFRWDLERGPVAAYTSQSGLTGDDVLSIATDGAGATWIALLDGGVARTSDGAGFSDLTPAGTAGLNPWALAAGGDAVWLATLGGGVSSRADGAWTPYTIANSALPSDDIYAVAVAGDGVPWIGTIGYGVAEFQGGDWLRYDLPAEIPDPRDPTKTIPNDAVTDVAVDPAGNVWFATDGSGAVVREAASGDWTAYYTGNSGLAGDFLQAIHIDGQGDLWFGTLGAGVSRLSSDRATWTTFSSANSPLREDDVLDVVTDANGGLWLASYDGGLSFYGVLPSTPPSFDLDPRGAPEFRPGEERGYFLWLDTATYRWTLAWSGDGRPHAFRGEIIADAPLTLVETADLEPEDIVEAEGERLSVDASEAEGQDRVTFEVGRQGARFTIRLQIDGAYEPFGIRLGTTGARPGNAPFQLAIPQPEPPQVQAGEDRTASEGDLVFFSGAFNDADSPAGHIIRWDFGDGTATESTLTPSHAYIDNGTYTVTLAVTDVHGTVGVDSLNVDVGNVAPQVDLSADPFSPAVGQLVVFTGFFFDPGQADSHTFTWDFGDGAGPVETVGPTAEHAYSSAGEYRVTLAVADDDGGVGEAALTLLVTGTNLAPEVEAGGDAALDEGSALTRTGSFRDPDSTAWSGSVDYGDGSGPEELVLGEAGSFELGHTYLDNGAYTVTVTIHDDEGAAGSASFSVTVQNVAPVVYPGGDAELLEGGAISRTGTFTDPGADVWTGQVDYGDGSPVEALSPGADRTFHLSHTYLDDGTYAVTVTITDDEGASGAAALTATVRNAAASVNAGEDAGIVSGETFEIRAGFVDPGVLDTHTATIDWGAGEGPVAAEVEEADGAGTAFGSRRYTAPGGYTIEVCVTDDDGAAGCDSLILSVTALLTGIDIWPFLEQNIIFAGRSHPVPVAILSAQGFDAPAEVDRVSLTFGKTGDEDSLTRCLNPSADVNGDGLADLLCVFRSGPTGLQLGDTEAILKGETHDGRAIEGRDSILVVSFRSIPVFGVGLRGADVVPPVETQASGDAGLIFVPGAGSYVVHVERLEAVTGIHLHCGARGFSGPVGVTLFRGDPVTRRVFQGRVVEPDAENACGWADLSSVVPALWSGGAYIDVHTAAHPEGELRGQIEVPLR